MPPGKEERPTKRGSRANSARGDQHFSEPVPMDLPGDTPTPLHSAPEGLRPPKREFTSEPARIPVTSYQLASSLGSVLTSTAIVVYQPTNQPQSNFSSSAIVRLNSTSLRVKKMSRGSSFVLFVGAFLSWLDSATDFVAIANYLRHSNTGFAKAMILIMSLSMFFHLFVVLVQHKKMGLSTLLVEVFLTVTYLSPGVNAYRVAIGREKHANETLDARTLLLWVKCAEIVFEAVPGLILQLFAYLTLPVSGPFAFVSITISVLTTAFNASVMFKDKDTDPTCRKLNPSFYGVFNIDHSSLAFCSLFMFSGAHVVSKALGVALFWATFGGDACFIYYGCELVAFFIVKALRNDFFYWLPVSGLPANIVVALVLRSANKVMVDFTGILQARHPCECGGLHYTLSLVWSQMSAVISVVLYQQFYDENGGDGEDKRRSKIGGTTMYSIVSALALVWFASFYCFARSINQEYLHTFFGTMTGAQYTVHVFRNAESDRSKMSIFKRNELYWDSIRDEVKAFTQANWFRWQAEKPEWFTKQFVATIPDEFIPVVNKEDGAVVVRRGSAFLQALGLLPGPQFHGTSDTRYRTTSPTTTNGTTAATTTTSKKKKKDSRGGGKVAPDEEDSG